MTKKQKEYVCETIDIEGSADYAFRFYSNFEEIKDKKFHELREAYIKAVDELEKYVGWDEYGQ
jgi:hypothetical protein